MFRKSYENLATLELCAYEPTKLRPVPSDKLKLELVDLILVNLFSLSVITFRQIGVITQGHQDA